jgi:hypothetical protein
MDLLKLLRAQWDRVGAVVLVIGALVALLLGYIGVSNTEFVAAQMPYVVSGGIFGLFLLGLGAILWLSADMRDEWCKLEDAERVLRRIEERLPSAVDAQREASHADNGNAQGSTRVTRARGRR